MLVAWSRPRFTAFTIARYNATQLAGCLSQVTMMVFSITSHGQMSVDKFVCQHPEANHYQIAGAWVTPANAEVCFTRMLTAQDQRWKLTEAATVDPASCRVGSRLSAKVSSLTQASRGVQEDEKSFESCSEAHPPSQDSKDQPEVRIRITLALHKSVSTPKCIIAAKRSRSTMRVARSLMRQSAC